MKERKKRAIEGNGAQVAAKLASATDASLRASDQLYCMKCVYHGAFTEGYLCNYIMMTGHRRGCDAGVGCGMRKPIYAEDAERKRICQSCGARYEGGPYSRLCPDCRRAVFQKNAMGMVLKRKEKKTP